MQLRRWTPLTGLFPRRYLDRERSWESFDFHAWSAETYEWTEDPWNGFRDFARRPGETVERARGDCEDYALVAVSWAVANGHSGVGLAFCWEFPYPWPTHVVAFDDEWVYSSGERIETTLDEWVADSRYDFALRRHVT